MFRASAISRVRVSCVVQDTRYRVSCVCRATACVVVGASGRRVSPDRQVKGGLGEAEQLQPGVVRLPLGYQLLLMHPLSAWSLWIRTRFAFYLTWLLFMAGHSLSLQTNNMKSSDA